MRAHTTIAVLWAALGLAAGGCSGKGDAGNKDQFLAQLCAEFSDCCKAAGRPSDGAQCRAFYGAFTSASSYDQSSADACLSEVRALSDKCASGSMNTPSCNKVFAGGGGSKKPGETCEDDGDCASAGEGQVQCAISFVNNASVQQCQVLLPGKAGSTPCVGTVNGNETDFSGNADSIPTTGYLCDLADGLVCDSQSGACQAVPAVGAACGNGFYECMPTAFCSFTDNTCQGRLQVGAACDNNDDSCIASAYCESASKTCTAKHALNEACTMNAECASDNCSNSKCTASDDLSLSFLCGSN